MQFKGSIVRSGDDKKYPFTVVVVNNILLETREDSREFYSDPLKHEEFLRGAQKIEDALWGNLEGQSESAFIDEQLAAKARLLRVEIERPITKPRNGPAWSFITHQSGSTMLVPRSVQISEFVKNRLKIVADVVFILTGSRQSQRPSAKPGVGDRHKPYNIFSIEISSLSRQYRHCHWPVHPGTVAFHFADRAFTAVHEFTHAVSTYNANHENDAYDRDGIITDLYVDNQYGINKRFPRSMPPIKYFAHYIKDKRKTLHRIDRKSLTHPPDWDSYHCAKAEKRLPAIMDNYLYASQDMHKCRHDTITRQFVLDRVAARMSR